MNVFYLTLLVSFVFADLREENAGLKRTNEALTKLLKQVKARSHIARERAVAWDFAQPRVEGDNSCWFANDGECDHGINCEEGTDCTDCGMFCKGDAWKDKEGVHDDSCSEANDGTCDDFTDFCEYGTDCTDCGTCGEPL